MVNRDMEREDKGNMRLADRLAEALNSDGIRYCHWKSNEHLQAGLEGKTDLDLLVDREDCSAFMRVLADLGFRKVISSPETTYIAVENWIGFCYRTGILIHLHVHYELVTGMEYVKEYAFPWGDYVLDTAVRDAESGLLVTNPNVEIILLLLRLGVKAKYGTLQASRLRKIPPYGEAMQRELDFLHERISCDGLEDALEKMFSKESQLKETMRQLVFKKKPDAASLMIVKHQVERELGNCRRYGRVESRMKSSIGSLKLKRNLVRERMGLDVQRRKRFETGGSVIAIIGEDGKALENLTRNTEKWLKWKMDIHRYPITGRGAKRVIERASQLRLKGSIVLLEGGPGNPGKPDKEAFSTKRISYGLHSVPDARSREEALWKKIEVFSPDVVIRLTDAGDQAETVRRIRPSTDEGSRGRSRTADTGRRHKVPRIYEVDGARSLEEVILDTRRIIWNNL